MPGCKYRFSGPSPLPPRSTSPSPPALRPLRALPLTSLHLLSETFLPGASKNSLRLIYFRVPQVLALSFPHEGGKARISAPARWCSFVREGDLLVLRMPVGKLRFYKAGKGKEEVYREDKGVEAWVREEAGRMGENGTGDVRERDGEGWVEARCRVLGNAKEEGGSAERLAHGFAEFVVELSSVPRTQKERSHQTPLVRFGEGNGYATKKHNQRNNVTNDRNNRKLSNANNSTSTNTSSDESSSLDQQQQQQQHNSLHLMSSPSTMTHPQQCTISNSTQFPNRPQPQNLQHLQQIWRLPQQQTHQHQVQHLDKPRTQPAVSPIPETLLIPSPSPSPFRPSTQHQYQSQASFPADPQPRVVGKTIHIPSDAELAEKKPQVVLRSATTNTMLPAPESSMLIITKYRNNHETEKEVEEEPGMRRGREHDMFRRLQTTRATIRELENEAMISAVCPLARPEVPMYHKKSTSAIGMPHGAGILDDTEGGCNWEEGCGAKDAEEEQDLIDLSDEDQNNDKGDDNDTEPRL